MVALDHRNVIVGDTHAAPAAASDSLYHYRIPDFLGDYECFLLVLDQSIGTRRSRNARFLGQRPADLFVFERLHRPRAGANEANVAAFADICEMGVLGEESVAWMDGVHIRDFRRADEAVDAQIALGALSFTDANGLVGQLNVHGISIRLGIDRDRADVQFLAGADDANRNLAPVGDQDLFKHDGLLRCPTARRTSW